MAHFTYAAVADDFRHDESKYHVCNIVFGIVFYDELMSAIERVIGEIGPKMYRKFIVNINIKYTTQQLSGFGNKNV